MDNSMNGGRGDGPIPFRKIPGPASKTLMRSVPTASGKILNMVSGPITYSSAVTERRSAPGPACSKRLTSNVFRPSADRQPTSSGGIVNQNSGWETPPTTCLFCSDRITFTETGNPEITKQMIKTLCYHMQMDSKQLPNEFTNAKFPFCDSCEELLEDLRRNQKIIEEAQSNITRTVNAIERIVADEELRESSSFKSAKPMGSSTAPEQQKFTQLRSMILEVYLNKLAIRKNLRKTMNFRNQSPGLKRPRFSHMSVMRDENIKRKFSSLGPLEVNLKSELPSFISVNNHTEEVEVESMTIEMNPMDLNGTHNEESADELALQEWNVSESLREEDLQMERSSSNQNTSTLDSWEGYQDAHYDENKCTLVISNVRGGNKNPVVKPETSRAPPEDENESYYSNEVITPIGTGTQKRKLLFEGIEIYRGTCDIKGGDYLQCSRCPHRIPITKYYEKRIVSAYVRMKIHIKNLHQQKKKQPPSKKQKTIASEKYIKVFSCRTCNKRFPNAKKLRSHEKLHNIPSLECDICGRSVKGWLKNLMTHKFSHKNDEERRAAIAAGELGANNTLLSNKVNTPLFKKHIPKPKKYIRKKPKKHVVVVSKENNVTTVSDLPCTLCPRKFTRRCYLALHMKTHNSDRTSKSKAQLKFKRNYKVNRTEVANDDTIIESDDSDDDASEPPNSSELMDFVMPPGTNVNDIVVEENDTIDSNDGINGWIEEDEDEDQD